MSRYEWEKGEFKLPSAEWAGFKAAIREAVNHSNAAMYEAALKLHGELGAALKGKRGADVWDTAWDLMDKLYGGSRYHHAPRFGEDETMAIVEAVVQRSWSGNKQITKVRKPQKKQFPQHGNNVTSFDLGECSVHFDNATRTATWRVEENNHACDRARESALGKALFAALDKVNWTRGTGGRIWGNDEYNRDSGRDYEGGGGSYSKGSYGPEESRRKAEAVKAGHGRFGLGYGRW